MNKLIMSLIVAGVLFGITLFGFALWGISLNNQEINLRSQVEALQQDNKQQLANLRNKFAETAQVSNKEIDLLTTVFSQYAESRGTSGGSLVKMVTEAVPNINPTTLKNLQNIIESSRNAWVSRQTALIDVNRAHKNLIRQFPGNVLFSMLNRKEIQIVVVTSSDAEKAFETGKEEAVDLFKK